MNYHFDKTISPEKKSIFIIRYESPFEIWENMTKEDYKIEKKQIQKEALKIFKEFYPKYAEKIEIVDVATPLTGVKYTGVYRGAYEGFYPDPKDKNSIKELPFTLPKLDNFFMIGQWISPGGGLPPSAMHGKWITKILCKKDKKKFIIKD